MRNYIQKHKIVFTTVLVILSFAAVLSFSYSNISTGKINLGSGSATVETSENAGLETNSEEKEAPQFNIFSILNKFIPN